MVGAEPTIGRAGIDSVSIAAQQHVAANVDLAIDDAEFDAWEKLAIEDNGAAGFGHAVTRAAVVREVLWCGLSANDDAAKQLRIDAIEGGGHQ
jgi:hypothetical protein